MAWIDVGDAMAIPQGGMSMYAIKDVEIIVYHLAEGWFATVNMCTHQDCSLFDEGEMEDEEIVCLCHGGAFDIRDGRATRMPCVVPLETFPVQIVDERIQVDFE